MVQERLNYNDESENLSLTFIPFSVCSIEQHSLTKSCSKNKIDLFAIASLRIVTSFRSSARSNLLLLSLKNDMINAKEIVVKNANDIDFSQIEFRNHSSKIYSLSNGAREIKL